MHTDLSAHLHTPECNELIAKLKDCHIQFPIQKFFGYCNSLDSAMVKCLKAERLAKRNKNYEKAQLFQEKLRLRKLEEQKSQQ